MMPASSNNFTVRYTVEIEILSSTATQRRYSSSTCGWSEASASTRAITRRCSVMRMPVAAQRASMPVAFGAGGVFNRVMEFLPWAELCHLGHLTTSRDASEVHSTVPRWAADNSARGVRRRQSRNVHKAAVPVRYFPRPREICGARLALQDDRDASAADCETGRGRV